MTKKQGIMGKLVCVAALGGTLLGQPVAAQEETKPENVDRSVTSIDFGAGIGYASNPLLLDESNTGSAFGRISAYLQHVSRSERSSTTLSAYIEDNAYFRHHGSRPAFSLGASTSHRTSEKTTVYGNLGFSGDFGGQLVGRVYGVPITPVEPDPNQVTPPPVDIVDPGTVLANQRNYRVSGQVGFTTAVSERDFLGAAVGGDYTHTTGSGSSGNYSSLFQTVNWNRAVSESSYVGLQMSVREANYPGPNNSSTVFNPAATFSTRFSETWSATASAGVLVAKRRTPTGNDSNVSPSVSGSLCNTTDVQHFCISGGRSIQTSSTQGSLASWDASATYYRRLNVNDTLQFSAAYRRYRLPGASGGTFSSNFYSVTAAIDHRISDRFAVNGQIGYRKIDTPTGSIKGDANATISLRYRLGDL